MKPIRCFTCGKVLSEIYTKFEDMVKQDKKVKESLDILGVKRYCCRNMVLTCIDLSDKLIVV